MQCLHWSLTTKRRPASEQFVQNHAQAIHVRRRGHLFDLAGGLLRGHVRRCAEDFARERETAVAFHNLGQAEVGYVRLPCPIDQNVSGLQVAMQDAALVRVVDGVRDRGHQIYE